MNDNKKETLAGTVGEHANENHDHPGGETPAGAKIDATATQSPGKTGEQGALAGGPAPGHGRASGGPGSEADEATQIVADVAAHTPASDALQGAGDDRSDVEQAGGTTTDPANVGDRDR